MFSDVDGQGQKKKDQGAYNQNPSVRADFNTKPKEINIFALPMMCQRISSIVLLRKHENRTFAAKPKNPFEKQHFLHNMGMLCVGHALRISTRILFYLMVASIRHCAENKSTP